MLKDEIVSILKNESSNKNVLIVCRHACVIRWLQSKGIDGKILPVARTCDVSGKVIIGCNLPIHLVSFAKYAVMIYIKNDSGKPFEELTPEDMDQQFMQVQVYHIDRKKIDLNDEKIVNKINNGEFIEYE